MKNKRKLLLVLVSALLMVLVCYRFVNSHEHGLTAAGQVPPPSDNHESLDVSHVPTEEKPVTALSIDRFRVDAVAGNSSIDRRMVDLVIRLKSFSLPADLMPYASESEITEIRQFMAEQYIRVFIQLAHGSLRMSGGNRSKSFFITIDPDQSEMIEERFLTEFRNRFGGKMTSLVQQNAKAWSKFEYDMLYFGKYPMVVSCDDAGDGESINWSLAIDATSSGRNLIRIAGATSPDGFNSLFPTLDRQ